MAKQIISEEFKRMQVLAGLINESQLNEFEKLGIVHPNNFKSEQQESIDIESTVNEALDKFRKNGK